MEPIFGRNRTNSRMLLPASSSFRKSNFTVLSTTSCLYFGCVGGKLEMPYISTALSISLNMSELSTSYMRESVSLNRSWTV